MTMTTAATSAIDGPKKRTSEAWAEIAVRVIGISRRNQAAMPVDPQTVFGPYSDWPRKNPRPRRRGLTIGAFVSAFGLVLHCGVPLVG